MMLCRSEGPRFHELNFRGGVQMWILPIPKMKKNRTSQGATVPCKKHTFLDIFHMSRSFFTFFSLNVYAIASIWSFRVTVTTRII